MADVVYTYVKAGADANTLGNEIQAAGHADPISTEVDNAGNVSIRYPEGTTDPTEAQIQTVVDAHGGKPFAESQVCRNKEIDTRTQELIADGFTYNAKQFSLSENAQRYIMGLEQGVSLGLIVPSVDVTAKDDTKETLADAAAVTAFYAAALGAMKGHLDSGRDLKQDVLAAADQAALDAVVDNR